MKESPSVTSMCTYMPPPGKKVTSAMRSKLLSSEAVALFMLWFIIGDWVAVGNTVRESGQQGQRRPGFICRDLLHRMNVICAFVPTKEYSTWNKRQPFSLLMSGQGESHSEKVDICAYSSNSSSSRMGSSPPAKLVTITRVDKRFQWAGCFKTMWKTHNETHKI